MEKLRRKNRGAQEQTENKFCSHSEGLRVSMEAFNLHRLEDGSSNHLAFLLRL